MTLYANKLRGNDRAFTLVELLVVILIIGILLAIALPTFLGQQSQAHDADAKSKLNAAYKTFKSVQASGHYSAMTITELANDLAASEPELTVAAGPEGGAGVGDLNISEITPTSANSDSAPLTGFRADVLSRSGKLCIINVINNGQPDISCGLPVGGNPGGGGGNGGGGGSNPTTFSNDLIYGAQDTANGYNAALFTADADNSDVGQLIDFGGMASYVPVFSDSGTLYAEGADGSLLTVSGDGSTTEVAPASAYCGGNGLIAPTAASYGAPTEVAFAGDSRMNAVCQTGSGPSGNTYQIVRMDLNGTNVSVLKTMTCFCSPPQIAANSSTLVYLMVPGYNLYSIPQAGGSPTQVTTSGDVQTMALSSLGTLAVWRQGPGGRNIWTMPVSGGSYSQLTTDGTYKGQMQFSPDGSQLAYNVFNMSNSMRGSIYITPTTGGSPTVITQAATLNATGVVWLR